MGKVDDLYLYPLFADPKVMEKCSQSVAGQTFGHDIDKCIQVHVLVLGWNDFDLFKENEGSRPFNGCQIGF